MASEYKPNLGVVTLTASKTLDKNAHAGKVIALSAAAGMTVTLPASSGSGMSFEIVVVTTVTSNSYVIQVANSTDTIQGVIGLSTDIAGTSLPTSSTTDTITMNGTTTGGIKGSRVVLTDVASGTWALSGGLVCSGTEATPFSAAV